MQNPPSHRRNVAALAMLWLTLAAAPVSGAPDWWNPNWTARMRVVVDTTSEGVLFRDAPGSVPVLLRLHGGIFPFTEAASGGGDLKFVADDQQTILPHRIERYEDLLQEALVWVLPPPVEADSRTTFWLYYGATGADAARDEGRVHDPQTVLAYPFSHPSSVAPRDASGLGNHAGNPGITVEGSLIAGGLRLTGRQAISIPGTPTLAWTRNMPLTISVWVSPDDLRANAAILSRAESTSAFELGLHEGKPYVSIVENGRETRVEGQTAISPRTWRHVAVVSDGSFVHIYLNGAPVGSAPAALPSMEEVLLLGRGVTEQEGFSGQLDELVVAHTARSQAHLRFLAVSQGTSTEAQRLVAVEPGGESAVSAWSQVGGYFAVIINAITTEGWVILVLLALMSAFSWMIMVLKVLQLNGCERANQHFVSLWRHVSNDLAVLDNPESIEAMGGDMNSPEIHLMRKAPMFMLYHTGIDEIRNRVRGNARGMRKLSGISMQAIRASMDGTFVRESQKLNAKNVYLTIAISGGPFLGLLGTVVGVTITFAAIASAGDVNINTIAPGVAAALTTTIAGLGVAIPALFGYNYIVIRIRDIINNMRVFNDEFVTKAAEFYSKKGGDFSVNHAVGEAPEPPADKEPQPVASHGN